MRETPNQASAAVLQQINEIWFLSAMRAAASFNIASRIGDSSVHIRELAQQVGIKEERLFRLLRLLSSRGYFIAEEDYYRNTPLSHCLRDDILGSQRAMALVILGKRSMQQWTCLEEVLRTGTNAVRQVFGLELYQYFDLPEHQEERALFDEALKDFASLVDGAIAGAYPFAGHIVDVGGGAGTLLGAIAERYPGTHLTLFERPEVIAACRQSAPNFDLVAGDFFQSIPTGDILIYKEVLHNWPDEECVKILRIAHQAISEQGILLLSEQVVGSQNAGNFAVMLDLLMMLEQNGQERTLEEYESLLAQAGFALDQITPTHSPHTLLVAKKALE